TTASRVIRFGGRWAADGDCTYGRRLRHGADFPSRRCGGAMVTLAGGHPRGERRLGFGRVVVAPSVPVRAETAPTGRREVGASHQAGGTGERDGAREQGGGAAASAAREISSSGQCRCSLLGWEFLEAIGRARYAAAGFGCLRAARGSWRSSQTSRRSR